jgi:hypothetical protein
MADRCRITTKDMRRDEASRQQRTCEDEHVAKTFDAEAKDEDKDEDKDEEEEANHSLASRLHGAFTASDRSKQEYLALEHEADPFSFLHVNAIRLSWHDVESCDRKDMMHLHARDFVGETTFLNDTEDNDDDDDANGHDTKEEKTQGHLGGGASHAGLAASPPRSAMIATSSLVTSTSVDLFLIRKV